MTQATTDDPRRRVADAACALVAEGGLEHATMRRVAARLGTTTGFISHYFADKDELLQAALSAALDDVTRRVTETGASSGLEEWLGLVEQALPHDEASERFWRVLVAFEAASLVSDKLSRVLQTYAADGEWRLAELLSTALPQGLEDDAVRRTARAVWVVVDGIGTTAVTNPGALSAGQRSAVLRSSVQALIEEATGAGA
ncbi:TetR/AcrR family transcriptional regulator [Tomitella fengzijianii]|nr:TetR/AcrR family transcriptional regulator [Tomitella fengzijianii]